ncbi:MAG: hypothetical protein JOZ07_12705 [Solirubrobacterales bacterium]|nr:hypothetical protein [Solirubrobacterales bacterium]
MLDVRIYRTGLAVAAMALVVLAFSLANQQGARQPSLAPDAFNAANVSASMTSIAARDPSRRPGSFGDDALAAQVSRTLTGDRFSVRTDTFRGRTVDGARTLENVIATRLGTTSGAIVVTAPRDLGGGTGADGLAGLSGTATLLELGRDLGGETLNRTIVLASTSASQGTAGALRLASTLAGPIDAVIVLGDLASAHPHQPIVVPWSNRARIAPPVLRDTLGAALQAQSSVTSGSTGLPGQFAELAFPFTIGEQAPFGDRGVPAVTLSVSGDAGPRDDAQLAGTPQLTGLGRAVLSTVSALDGAALPRSSAYLELSGKLIPRWAIALFVLALLLPVALTSVDALARARRRGHVVGRSLAFVLAAAIPFALALAVVLAARLLGVISAAPPGPVGPGAIPLDSAGIAVLAVAALVAIGSAAAVIRLARSRLAAAAARAPSRRPRGAQRSSDGLAVALIVVLWLITFAIWLRNPFAAALLIPAVHLWLWATDSELRIALPVRLGMIALGLAPIALVVVYYANADGYGPWQLIWSAALLVAGHVVGLTSLLEWCVVLGCLVTAASLVLRAAREPSDMPATVTVRGPITYAGPGSLGGTESALRR